MSTATRPDRVADVAHQWAHNLGNPAGRRHGESGNLSYFRSTCRILPLHKTPADCVDLKSYAATIGRITTGADGHPVAILSDRHYSVTTTSHQREARYATRHLRTVHVPGWAHDDPLPQWDAEIENATAGAQPKDAAGATIPIPRRAKAYVLLRDTITQSNAYRLAFGLPTIPAPDNVPEIDAWIAQADERHANRSAAARKRALAIDADNRQSNAERIDAWLAGDRHVILRSEHHRVPFQPRVPLHTDTDYLRLNPANPDEVQTSRGAFVPLDHVRLAAPAILRLIRSGGTYRRNGHSIHLGHYAVDEITADGTVRVGCHTFSRAEIERFASVIGAE